MNELIPKWLQGIGTLLIGLALVIGLVLVKDSASGKQNRTLSVTGKATRAITPNQSVISGSFEETASTAEEARTNVRTKTATSLAAIKQLGIEEKKITTTNVSVVPEYDYTAGKQKLTGYRAISSLAITLEDTAKADVIIETLTKNKAQSTSGPDAGLTTVMRNQLEQELRLEAIANAKAQAEALAQQAGGKLGKVISIGSGSLAEPGMPIPMPYELSARTAADTVSSSPTDITIGEKEVSLTVSVSYQLR